MKKILEVGTLVKYNIGNETLVLEVESTYINLTDRTKPIRHYTFKGSYLVAAESEIKALNKDDYNKVIVRGAKMFIPCNTGKKII